MPPNVIEPYQYVPHGIAGPPGRGEIWNPGPAVSDVPMLVLHNDGTLAVTIGGNPRRELRMELVVWQFSPAAQRWWCDASVLDADVLTWLHRYL